MKARLFFFLSWHWGHGYFPSLLPHPSWCFHHLVKPSWEILLMFSAAMVLGSIAHGLSTFIPCTSRFECCDPFFSALWLFVTLTQLFELDAHAVATPFSPWLFTSIAYCLSWFAFCLGKLNSSSSTLSSKKSSISSSVKKLGNILWSWVEIF